MTKMSKNDRLLLEELENNYGKDILASALLQIANGYNNDEECCEGSCSPKEAVLNFIQYLEGARIRMREIHWETEHNSIHTLTDDYIGKLEDYEDSLAENLMGVCGFRIKVGEIMPIMPEATNLKDLMNEIHENILSLIVSVDDQKEYTGIVNVLEEMAHELGKGKFLETMK